jgi:hypothetical protein
MDHEEVQITRATIHSTHTSSEQEFDKKFKPKGAIAFFVLLIILGLIIWYGIYFLMLERI